MRILAVLCLALMLPQDEARGAVFELCYGDGSLPPGKRVCLPAALFIDLYPPPSR